MTSNFSEHTNANYFLHTGNGLQGRPSMGAWAGYGLGSENQDLPGFVVVNGGLVPPEFLGKLTDPHPWPNRPCGEGTPVGRSSSEGSVGAYA